MIGLRDAEAFRAKSTELQGVILEAMNQAIEAREAYAAQLNRIRALEAEVAELKAWGAEKERYELKKVGVGGTVAYMLKREARGPEPPHWLCPNGYAQGKKAFLQGGSLAGANRVYSCPNCDTRIAAREPAWLD
jgi:hypothetical protein